MTDKLAEAIVAMEGYSKLGYATIDDAKLVTKAARKYHAIPVVDVDQIKREVVFPALSINRARGWLDCLDHLRATYPNGLKWKV
jgi:hypothetical protein